jgi:hypothetical protein
MVIWALPARLSSTNARDLAADRVNKAPRRERRGALSREGCGTAVARPYRVGLAVFRPEPNRLSEVVEARGSLGGHGDHTATLQFTKTNHRDISAPRQVRGVWDAGVLARVTQGAPSTTAADSTPECLNKGHRATRGHMCGAWGNRVGHGLRLSHQVVMMGAQAGG